MTTPPSPLEEQAEISLQESRRSDNAHYVFQDGHWTKPGMRAHCTPSYYRVCFYE